MIGKFEKLTLEEHTDMLYQYMPNGDIFKGDYDISIDTNTGDFEAANGFDTAILMTIFEQRRASASETPNPQFRGGWCGNQVNQIENFEIGSKAWLLKNSRRTQDNINLLETYLQDGFQWMVEDGHADSVEVIGSMSADGFSVIINFIRNNTVFDSKSFDLWQNTGNDLS
jgi:phage gp46-like protein